MPLKIKYCSLGIDEVRRDSAETSRERKLAQSAERNATRPLHASTGWPERGLAPLKRAPPYQFSSRARRRGGEMGARGNRDKLETKTLGGNWPFSDGVLTA